MTGSSSSDTSFLLWALGVAVAVLGAHVALGWIRHGQREPQWRTSWLPMLLAALTLGSTVCASMVLGLSAESLPFRLGYRGVMVLAVWVAAVAGCVPLAALLIHSQGWVATLSSGVLLAALTTAVQMGWIGAAGFRPGVVWSNEFIGTAGVLMAIAFVYALRVAYSSAGTEGERRQLWRVGASTLLALALVGGQEIVKAGAGLMAQVGSVYSREVPATVLALVAGVALPLGMSLMFFDLHLRSRAHRRRHRRRRSSRTTQPAPLREPRA